jgi:hypothetical protein
MARFFVGAAILLMWSVSVAAPGAFAQLETPTQTIKGVLMSVNGHVYVIRDIFGRFVLLQVDKSTKQERLLVPGETIEADVIQGERVVALRAAK